MNVEIAKKMQELTIRLFFDASLQEQVVSDKDKLLDNHDIPISYKKYLFDVSSESFVAESFGRRSLIARELKKRFEKFFSLTLAKKDPSLSDIVNCRVFCEFVASDCFFSNRMAFPHYTGIGPGYENSSKFFLFCLARYESNPSLAISREMLLELYSGMANHLLFQSKFCNSDFFRYFSHGVRFDLDDEVYLVVPGKRVLIRPGTKIPDKVGNLNHVARQIIERGKNE